MILLDVALGLKAMHSCFIAHTNLTIDNIIKVKETHKISNLESSVDLSHQIPENWTPKNIWLNPPEILNFKNNNH